MATVGRRVTKGTYEPLANGSKKQLPVPAKAKTQRLSKTPNSSPTKIPSAESAQRLSGADEGEESPDVPSYPAHTEMTLQEKMSNERTVRASTSGDGNRSKPEMDAGSVQQLEVDRLTQELQSAQASAFTIQTAFVQQQKQFANDIVQFSTQLKAVQGEGSVMALAEEVKKLRQAFEHDSSQGTPKSQQTLSTLAKLLDRFSKQLSRSDNRDPSELVSIRAEFLQLKAELSATLLSQHALLSETDPQPSAGASEARVTAGVVLYDSSDGAPASYVPFGADPSILMGEARSHATMPAVCDAVEKRLVALLFSLDSISGDGYSTLEGLDTINRQLLQCVRELQSENDALQEQVRDLSDKLDQSSSSALARHKARRESEAAQHQVVLEQEVAQLTSHHESERNKLVEQYETQLQGLRLKNDVEKRNLITTCNAEIRSAARVYEQARLMETQVLAAELGVVEAGFVQEMADKQSKETELQRVRTETHQETASLLRQFSIERKQLLDQAAAEVYVTCQSLHSELAALDSQPGGQPEVSICFLPDIEEIIDSGEAGASDFVRDLVMASLEADQQPTQEVPQQVRQLEQQVRHLTLTLERAQQESDQFQRQLCTVEKQLREAQLQQILNVCFLPEGAGGPSDAEGTIQATGNGRQADNGSGSSGRGKAVGEDVWRTLRKHEDNLEHLRLEHEASFVTQNANEKKLLEQLEELESFISSGG